MVDLWMPNASRASQSGGVTLNTSLPPRATWHITWDAVTNGVQPPFENVSSYLKNVGYCPHIMWNPFNGEITQFYPANVGGRALNAWNEDGQVNIQIEIYFSPGVVVNGKTYNTVAETPCVGLDKLLAWIDTFGVPRVWPMGAPQWQGNARNVDIWNTKAGHYGHCNVPDNTHTDPGPMPSLTKIAAVKPVVAPSTTSGKTINQLVDEVNKGLHGSGDARVKSLGKMYNAVQAEINRRAGASVPAAVKPTKTIAQLVAEVNAGKHGNGAQRQASLGANYQAVQAEINRQAGAGSVNISALADAAIQGVYGDGETRKIRLGANYAAVQAEINRRYA